MIKNWIYLGKPPTLRRFSLFLFLYYESPSCSSTATTREPRYLKRYINRPFSTSGGLASSFPRHDHVDVAIRRASLRPVSSPTWLRPFVVGETRIPSGFVIDVGHRFAVHSRAFVRAGGYSVRRRYTTLYSPAAGHYAFTTLSCNCRARELLRVREPRARRMIAAKRCLVVRSRYHPTYRRADFARYSIAGKYRDNSVKFLLSERKNDIASIREEHSLKSAQRRRGERWGRPSRSCTTASFD